MWLVRHLLFVTYSLTIISGHLIFILHKDNQYFSSTLYHTLICLVNIQKELGKPFLNHTHTNHLFLRSLLLFYLYSADGTLICVIFLLLFCHVCPIQHRQRVTACFPALQCLLWKFLTFLDNTESRKNYFRDLKH